MMGGGGMRAEGGTEFAFLFFFWGGEVVSVEVCNFYFVGRVYGGLDLIGIYKDNDL